MTIVVVHCTCSSTHTCNTCIAHSWFFLSALR